MTAEWRPGGQISQASLPLMRQEVDKKVAMLMQLERRRCQTSFLREARAAALRELYEYAGLTHPTSVSVETRIMQGWMTEQSAEVPVL